MKLETLSLDKFDNFDVKNSSEIAGGMHCEYNCASSDGDIQYNGGWKLPFDPGAIYTDAELRAGTNLGFLLAHISPNPGNHNLGTQVISATPLSKTSRF